MLNIKSIGRYLFTLPFAILGLMHLFQANEMKGLVPSFVPGGVIWVYLIGIALIAASLSFITEKHTYLAGLLTATLLVIFVFTIYIPAALNGNQLAMSMALKEIGLAGGALLLASNYKLD